MIYQGKLLYISVNKYVYIDEASFFLTNYVTN